MFEAVKKITTQIKQQRPLILNITNDVTMDFIANGLLSIGASPLMSKAPAEMEDLMLIANALVINPGTLDEDFITLCKAACMAANKFNKPIILDPVGVGASRYRTETCKKLITDYDIAIVRGNASEMMALAGLPQASKGVDSSAASELAIASAENLVKAFGVTVAISGKTDIVVGKDQQLQLSRGAELMPLVTGSGCLLSAVVAAFRAIEVDSFKACVSALLFYSVCGEVAANTATAPGSFKAKFLDTLYATPEASHYETY